MAWANYSISLLVKGLGARDPYADPERYVRPHNLITLLSDSLRLYGENWRVVAGIYLVPALALAIVDHWIGQRDSAGFWPMLYVLLSILLLGPLTVAVSEACLGVAPRVRRTFRRVSRKLFVMLMGAVFLQLALMFSGFLLMVAFFDGIETFLGGSNALGMLILLVVVTAPMTVFGAWYMFIQPAIVLDHCTILKSFARSRYLGQGYFLRNLIYALTVGNLLVLAGWLGSFILDRFHRPDIAANWVTEAIDVVITSLPGLLFTPIISIALVLLYYDLRVRKEGLGLEQLEQELND